MTYEEAVKKASSPVLASNGQSDAYAIPFERHNDVMALVGKTLKSADPKNTNTMYVVEVVMQNYVVRINDTDNYNVSPAMWTLQNIASKRIVVA